MKVLLPIVDLIPCSICGENYISSNFLNTLVEINLTSYVDSSCVCPFCKNKMELHGFLIRPLLDTMIKSEITPLNGIILEVQFIPLVVLDIHTLNWVFSPSSQRIWSLVTDL